MIKTFEKEMQAEVQRLREVDKAVAERKKQARLRALERAATGQADPISAYNEAVPIEIPLEMHGFKEKGSRLLSPNTSSGVPGGLVRGNHYFSHHAGDAGIGRPAGPGIIADAFDLFVYFEHGGDFNRALIAAGDRFTVQDPIKGDIVTINKFNQRQYKRQQDPGQQQTVADPRVQPEVKPTPPPKVKITSLFELRERNPQVDAIVPGFLNRGEALVIHAPGGVGKSMLTLDIAVQLGTKNPELLFGKFEIPKVVTSLFLQTENSAATINSRIRAMVGNDPRSIEALELITMPVLYDDILAQGRPFTDAGNRTLILQTIEAASNHIGHKIDIIWVDPLISFCSGDENDSAKMRLELDALNEICQETKVTPVVVHHDNRAGGYRGSSAIFDWCRSMISLSREYIGSDRITDINADGVPIKRVKPVPCVRMIHEKSNNNPRFDSMLLRMNSHLNFEVVQEALTPEQQDQGNMVVQALTDLGGTAESHNELSKVYATLAGVGIATAKRHVTSAVSNDFIIRKSILEKGTHAYKYVLPE